MNPEFQSIVCTDLDGTLLNSAREISSIDRETLTRLGRMGVARVVCTGRNLYSAQKVLNRDDPIDYLIFSSGAGVVDWSTQKLKAAHNLTAEDAAFAYQCLCEHKLNFMIHRSVPQNHQFYYVEQGDCPPDFLRRLEVYQDFGKEIPASGMPHESFSQFVVVDGQRDLERLQRLSRDLKHLRVIRTTSPLDHQTLWIEVFPPHVDKGQACQRLAVELGIASDRYCAIGNDYNDEGLLAWGSFSFVVENAPNELKDLYRVVRSHEESGFSDAISQWEARTN